MSRNDAEAIADAILIALAALASRNPTITADDLHARMVARMTEEKKPEGGKQ